jgi:ATP adenylyltransferase
MRTNVHYVISLFLLKYYLSQYQSLDFYIMNHLWSPWRMTYIQEPKMQEGCVFCGAQALPDGLENQIVHRGKHAYVILNRYPYTSGHLMVVSKEHKPDLEDFIPEVRSEIMELTTQCIQVLRLEYKAEGFNIGANLGTAAGAGLPKHFHLHIVPRWGGDTNFMSSIGEVRVVPEDLEKTYKRILCSWNQIDQQT